MQCPQCSVKQCRKCSSRTMNRCGSCFAACCITPPPPPPPPPPQCFLHYSTSWTQTPLHLATILSCPFKLLVDRIRFFILSLYFLSKDTITSIIQTMTRCTWFVLKKFPTIMTSCDFVWLGKWFGHHFRIWTPRVTHEKVSVKDGFYNIGLCWDVVRASHCKCIINYG